MTDSVHSANAETRSVQGHTPGPWWVTESGVRDSGGYIAFSLTTTHWPDQDERYAKEVLERKANMRLIAAAPELTDAVEMLLDVLDELDGECDGVAEFQAPIRMARAIHAKANGATP